MAEAKETKKESPKSEKEGNFAVVRIRGEIKINKDIKDTLNMLNLKKANTCVLLENNPSNLGMIRKVKDYVTWGIVDAETEKLLKQISNAQKDNAFRLNPPKGGYERKGVKKPFSSGGALGFRKNEINKLIKKML